MPAYAETGHSRPLIARLTDNFQMFEISNN